MKGRASASQAAGRCRLRHPAAAAAVGGRHHHCQLLLGHRDLQRRRPSRCCSRVPLLRGWPRCRCCCWAGLCAHETDLHLCECVWGGECTLHCCCRARLCAHEADLCVGSGRGGRERRRGALLRYECSPSGPGTDPVSFYPPHPAPEPGLTPHTPSDQLRNPVPPPPSTPTSASACWVTVASMPCRACSRDRQLRSPVSRSALCSWP